MSEDIASQCRSVDIAGESGCAEMKEAALLDSKLVLCPGQASIHSSLGLEVLGCSESEVDNEKGEAAQRIA